MLGETTLQCNLLAKTLPPIPGEQDDLPRALAAHIRNPADDGLGLAIVHAVCQRYGWSLSFDTVAPQGLRVEITGSIQEVSSNQEE